MTRLTAAVLVSMLSACITESAEEPTNSVIGEEAVGEGVTEAAVFPVAKPQTRDDVSNLHVDLLQAEIREPRCLLVSDTEGPCILACDPDKLLEEYVPQSTCVIFRCKLTTGDEMLLGGCNSPERTNNASIVRASP